MRLLGFALKNTDAATIPDPRSRKRQRNTNAGRTMPDEHLVRTAIFG
jgi:hypothetical protein